MRKLLNSDAATADHNEFRHRLLDSGLSSVSLFYCELMGHEEIKGRPCTAVARDVHALYKAWCARLGIRPCDVSHFVKVLRRQHGVTSKRSRYTIDGKQMGPHGILVLKAENSTLSAQIDDFRRFAAKVHDGALA